MKKFDKVVREGKLFVHTKGDDIVVTEKLDGANASISINNENKIKVYSRNNELNEENTLRNWYNYAHENVADKLKEFSHGLNLKSIVVFGEWLVSHSVAYKDEFYNKFYPFAIYNNETNEYLPFSFVEKFAEIASLSTPKVLFRGKFNLVSDFTDFVGKSEMTLEKDSGEGIVIFNETRLDSESRTKVIANKFSESNGIKKHQPKDLKESQLWIMQYVTEARVNKIIHKLIDEELLPTIEFKNFGLIASPVTELVYSDIIEEESDNKPELFDEKVARKMLNKLVPKYIREFIESNQMV